MLFLSPYGTLEGKGGRTVFSFDLNVLPSVKMTGKVRERRGWSHNGRAMSENLFVFFHGGECVFEVAGQTLSFTRGDVAIVPKGVWYRPHTASFCEYTFFHFDGELAPCDEAGLSLPALRDLPPGMPRYGVLTEEETRLFFSYKVSLGAALSDAEVLLSRAVTPEYAARSMHRLRASIRFSELLLTVSQSFCEQLSPETALPPTVARIIAFVRENYTRRFSLEELSDHVGASKQYCMRAFKRRMGTTINDYLTDLRMRHAAYLLRSTYMNVDQTADYLGFSSVSYFSRSFKKYYGVSPSEYKE